MTGKANFAKMRALSAVAFMLGGASARAEDQAKAIVNAVDPKSMNELLAMARTQPDAALTNVIPAGVNKFRFLFVWPAANTVMSFDRIGRSFAERFLQFANQQKSLAQGFCLTSPNMFFGSTNYASQDVNVAYRDIEVRYTFGWKAPCAGRYITSAELDRDAARQSGGYGMRQAQPAPRPANPEEGLKPFLYQLPQVPN